MASLSEIGDYTILGVLGEGGMATVYAAEERLSKRQVALKVMQSGLGPSPRLREMFLREMAILGRIDHPNVVRLHSSMEIEGQLVMVLELVRGETLRSMLRRLVRFPWPDAVRLVRQILAGLTAAHGQQPPVVHRDLKPENVMIAGDGTVKVMDFGIAKVLRDGTMATTDVGTLQYMCPEQIEGVAIDPRADLYNIGLILYEMLTGAPPFRSQSTRELLNAQCTEPPPPIAPELAYTLPAALVQLTLQLLAKSPNERPPSALTVLSRLDAVASAGGLEPTTGAPALGSAVAPTWPAAAQWAATDPSTAQWTGAATHPTSHAAGSSVRVPPTRAAPGRGIHPGTILAGVLALLLLAGFFGWATSRSTATDEPSRPDSTSPLASVGGTGTSPQVGAVACTVEGRHESVRDIVVVLLESRPTIAWLDGVTGETYRTLETETERVYCVTPQVLGVVRDDDTKLEMLDARSGEQLATVTAELGISGLTRVGGKVWISQPDGSYGEHPIPGCSRRGCAFPREQVPYGEVHRYPEAPGLTAGASMGTSCVSDGNEIRRGGVVYELRETNGVALVTAKRDGTRLWAKRIPIEDNGYLMRCAFQVDDHAVAVLRSNSQDGDLDIVRLDPADGNVLEEASIGTFGRTPIAVTAFVSNGGFLLVHAANSKQLLAYEPASHQVAWRR